MNEELKFNSLYDHYKESVEFLKQNLVKRDKLTLMALLLFIVYFFIEIQPNQSIAVVNTVIKAKLDFTLSFNYEVLNSGILFLIFLCLLNYYSLIINIETQYKYIHKIESDLNEIAGEDFIIRESGFYLNEYPLLLALVHRIYNFILPLIIIICMSYKVIKIAKSITGIFQIFVLNMVIAILIIIITILFLLFIYKGKESVQAINNVVKWIFIKIHLYEEDDDEVENDEVMEESNSI